VDGAIQCPPHSLHVRRRQPSTAWMQKIIAEKIIADRNKKFHAA
jgi:hypothetical protein